MAAMKNTSTGLEVILSTLFAQKTFFCNSILKRNAANGNGKPYEPNDIYWTALHIAKKAVIGHGSRRYYQGNVPNIEADTDNNGKIDTNDLFDIVYECALRGAGLKK